MHLKKKQKNCILLKIFQTIQGGRLGLVMLSLKIDLKSTYDFSVLVYFFLYCHLLYRLYCNRKKTKKRAIIILFSIV